jgi:hypothetical protein
MASPENLGNQFQWRVRPGLLLFVLSVLALGVFDKAGFAKSLGTGPSTWKHAILLVVISVTAFGWFLLGKDSASLRPRYKWITLAAAVVLTLSIAAYAFYDVVPIKFIIPFPLVSALETMLWRLQDGLLGLAWVVPFFGRGRSRIALVIGGTLMLFLWASTSQTINSPVYGWF